MILEPFVNYQKFFVGLSSNSINLEQNHSVDFCSLILFDLEQQHQISLEHYNVLFSKKIHHLKSIGNGQLGAKILSLQFPYSELKIGPEYQETLFLGVIGNNLEQTIQQFLKQITPSTQ